MENHQRILFGVCIILTFSMAGCIWIFRSVDLDTKKPDTVTESPFKAHLKDGRIAIFSNGASFGNEIIGQAKLYPPDLQNYTMISRLDTSEVAAYSVFKEEVNVTRSTLVSLTATAATAAVTPFILIAIFGSCPTIYAPDEDMMELRGELFSNSIAPLLEARDLITVSGPIANRDKLQLEIRNEALETHYINHLELLEVSHSPGSFVVPTHRNQVVSLKEFTPPEKAYSKSGKNLNPLIGEYDPDSESEGYVFDNWSENITNNEPNWDYVNLIFPPVENRSALHLKLRNSLFTTVLLYDFYLSGQGADALDWIGNRLSTVSEAVALGGFHEKYMGLRVHQYLDGDYRKTARISNVGPVSWKDLAVPIEPSGEDSVRIRLTFLADSWRIQSARLAQSVVEPDINILPATGLFDSENNELPQLQDIKSADKDYLVTFPGQRFLVDFPITQPPIGLENSYLLAGQGYYIEWIRQDWVKDASYPDGLPYDSDLIISAQDRWKDVKTDFTATFFESKIPVQ
jgi:hypothetical protein